MTTTELTTTERDSAEHDKKDNSWVGGAVACFLVGVGLRGLSHLDQFADGPLRHWWVYLAAIIAVAVLYQIGYRLVRR